tara:strand:- start:35 stop:493 length:459 start_codon:yes stop_codon:yes gene_type:complete
MRFKRKQWTAATLNEMLQGYRDGVSVADLAKTYDVTDSAIRQQASKYGVMRTAEYLSTVRRKAHENRAPQEKFKRQICCLNSYAPTDFINVYQVADRLGVCVDTIRRWTHDGRLKHYRFGRNVRIRVGDFLTFIQQAKQKNVKSGLRGVRDE